MLNFDFYFTSSTILGWKMELYTCMPVKLVSFSKEIWSSGPSYIIYSISCMITHSFYLFLLNDYSLLVVWKLTNNFFKFFLYGYGNVLDTVDLFPVASATTFFTDMHHLLRIISVGNVRSACYHRLRFLEEVIHLKIFIQACSFITCRPCLYSHLNTVQKFRLHLLVNGDREFLAQKSAPHRDFYNIRKVDTHVHHSACMNQKHLLRFIKSKLRSEPDEVITFFLIISYRLFNCHN